MSIQFIWALPTAGDGRYGNATLSRRGERTNPDQPYFTSGVSDPRGNHFNYLDYLHQIARAADLAGFDGIHIANDSEGDEPWIVAGYLARSTRHLTLLTAFDAARGSAVYAAKNAVSFQRYTNGRFAWHIGTGGDAAARRQQGDFAADADIAPRIEEFVTVARGVINSAPYSFKGRFFEVLDGGFKGPLGHNPAPLVYLSGNTDADLELSAKVADVHVFGTLAPAALAPAVARLQEQAALAGRQVAVGLRLDLLARETAEEAEADARRYLAQTGRQPLADTACPALWHGLHADAATLVGSHDDASQAIADYARAGVGHFILGAIPAFEEAYRVGEYILPRVRELTGTTTRRVA